MKIIGITMVKNEEDIIAASINNLLRQGVDHIFVADNLSTDNTPHILEQISNISVIEDTDIAYYQSLKMTNLARTAANIFGDCWIIPFDADELWYSKYGRLADVLRSVEEDIVYAKVWNMIPTNSPMNTYLPIIDMKFKQPEPERFPVVACKYHKEMVIQQGNHDVIHPGTRLWGDLIEVNHYQYRSYKQFRRKVVDGAKAIAATNLPSDSGLHWKNYAGMPEIQLKEEWNKMCSQEGRYDPFVYYA